MAAGGEGNDYEECVHDREVDQMRGHGVSGFTVATRNTARIRFAIFIADDASFGLES